VALWPHGEESSQVEKNEEKHMALGVKAGKRRRGAVRKQRLARES